MPLRAYYWGCFAPTSSLPLQAPRAHKIDTLQCLHIDWRGNPRICLQQTTTEGFLPSQLTRVKRTTSPGGSASGPLVNCKARRDASSTRRGASLSAVCPRSPDEASEGEYGRQDAQARTVPVWPCVPRGCEHHQGSSQVNARSPSHPQPAPLLARLSPRSVIMVPVNMAGTWATTAPR